MSRDVFRMFLEFTRKKTLDTLDAIAKRPDATAVLGWRPGLGRAQDRAPPGRSRYQNCILHELPRH